MKNYKIISIHERINTYSLKNKDQHNRYHTRGDLKV